MSFDQALEHSLPRLKLMHRAAERRQARAALLDLEVTQAAVASCFSKENHRLVKAVANKLTKMC